jgi:hypothetical protein
VRYTDNRVEMRRIAGGDVIAAFDGGRIADAAECLAASEPYIVIGHLDDPAEVRRVSDGKLLAKLESAEQILTGERVACSSDREATFIAITKSDAAEIWQVRGQVRRVARVQGSISATAFDPLNRYLAVSFFAPEGSSTYLLDIAWMQALGDKPQELPESALIALACDPKRAGGVDLVALREHLGGAEPRACQ